MKKFPSMKKRKIILLFYGILTILTISSCEKNDKLEFVEDTFSCYINGELFVPKGNTNLISTSPGNDGLSFMKFNSDLDLVIQVKNEKSKMVIYIKNFIDENEFSLENSNGVINYPFNNPETSSVLIYNDKKYLSKMNSGKLLLTEASDTNLEGTFEFTLYNENDDSDTIRITNGKFNN